MKKIAFLLAGLFVATLIHAQSVEGRWKTIDDETGKAKSIVEIYKKDGKLYGRIVELFREPNEDQDPVCKECEGAKHNQKIKGMVIVEGMIFDADDNEWDDGTILDPKNGTVYDCKLWLDEDNSNQLKVRGYVAFFFRTQTWIRVS